MMMDPMAFSQFGGWGPAVGPPMQPPIHKQMMTFSKCTLYPPNINLPPPTTRERPPGCRTIFVGGLPETCAEEHLTEVFSTCGEICSIRISNKNFAHIRFVS